MEMILPHINDLAQYPESRRDQAWEMQFLDAVIMSKVEVDGSEPTYGPDGWPYLKVKTAANGTEPFHKVVQWLASRGIGLVVNAHKLMPDYVFTYGMIWNFVETGRFVSPEKAQAAGEVVFSRENPPVVGAPSETYLPSYVRSVLREFLKAQGFAKPMVAVISTQDFKNVDLAFSAESLNNLPQNQHSTFAQALMWFLPQHYSLVIAEEKNLSGWTQL